MRYRIVFFLCFISNTLWAQVSLNNIWGNWVAVKITNKDGSALSDDNILKYTYLKYTFSPPDILYTSTTFADKGLLVNFEIREGLLLIKTPDGNVVNTIEIEDFKPDKLILLNGGRMGFDSPEAVRYYFCPEATYQKSLSITANDILSIYGGDTTYKANPKVYAEFKEAEFVKYLYNNIDGTNTMDNASGHLVASFIVSKFGVADSLKILQGISPAFDKRFIKAFKKAAHMWKPATMNGKYVNVQMFTELRYGSFDTAFPADQYTNKATDAFNAKAYDVALYYYDLALKNVSFDKQNLYRRGICKKMLGNIAGACADWNKVKELGGTEANALIGEYCH
jgi:hypothetical protein